MTPAVREALAEAEVVWLQVSADAAAARTGADSNRPLFAGRRPEEAIARLLAERAETYAAIATWTVTTCDREPDDIVDEVLALIEWSDG